MPHLAIEYSGNLDAHVGMKDFCEFLSKAMLATSIFEVGAVRVRAFRAEAYAIADLHSQNMFLDMSLRIGAGRSPDEKKRAGQAIYEAASQFLSRLFDAPHFALSFEIREIDPALSWKTNAIHPRLRER